MKITLFAVRHENKVYEFNEPLVVKIYKRGSDVWLRCDYFDIIEMSIDYETVIWELESHINFLWDSFAQCHDCGLDFGARQLKQRLLKLITVREIV